MLSVDRLIAAERDDFSRKIIDLQDRCVGTVLIWAGPASAANRSRSDGSPDLARFQAGVGPVTDREHFLRMLTTLNLSQKSSTRRIRIEPILHWKVSAEIGLAARLSDTLRMSGGSGMTPSSRDRISVDLHGLRAVLFELARARDVSPSVLVRDALSAALGQSEAIPHRVAMGAAPAARDRVRLTMRMSRADAEATLVAARRAGLAPGAFVAGLVAEVPALSAGSSRADHIAVLIASSGELSTLSRNIRHLTRLLREGNVHAALEYRDMLMRLNDDIRGHLTLASGVLAVLRPRRATGLASKPSTT